MAEVVDLYLDPDTGLLCNLIGARTQGALDQAEGDLTYIRAAELQERPIRGTGDLDEFRAIHRQLFQDVYPWAGEVRTVDLRKNVAGAEHFLSVGVIDRGSMFAAAELRADKMLRGMNRDQFIDRVSHHYDQWNFVHPFREGNGRTQRVFWNRVAADAGWQLDWRPVQGAVNDAACRAAAETRDFGPMRVMFDQVVSPADTSADPTSALDRFAPQGRTTLAWMPHGWRGWIIPRRWWRSRRTCLVLPRLSARSRTGRAGTKAQTSAASDLRQ